MNRKEWASEHVWSYRERFECWLDKPMPIWIGVIADVACWHMIAYAVGLDMYHRFIFCVAAMILFPRHRRF